MHEQAGKRALHGVVGRISAMIGSRLIRSIARFRQRIAVCMASVMPLFSRQATHLVLALSILVSSCRSSTILPTSIRLILLSQPRFVRSKMERRVWKDEYGGA